MAKLKLFIPLLVFAVLAVFLLRGLDRDPNALPSALLDRPVPRFALPGLLDPEVEVTDAVFKGRVSLLNVWATWCQPCRVEHPYLTDLAEQGVPIVGMNYKDSRAAANRWLEEHGNPYAASFSDAEGRLGIDLGVFGAPETYLVDSQGIIRFKHVGIVDTAVWLQQIKPIYEHLKGQMEVGRQ